MLLTFVIRVQKCRPYSAEVRRAHTLAPSPFCCDGRLACWPPEEPSLSISINSTTVSQSAKAQFCGRAWQPPFPIPIPSFPVHPTSTGRTTLPQTNGSRLVLSSSLPSASHFSQNSLVPAFLVCCLNIFCNSMLI